MDFLSFFGLKEDPFKLTPDPAYYYPSASHNEGLLLMDYSIEQKEGFLLIIGDPGTGKTTMLRVFLERWKDKAEIAIVLTPRLSPEEFLLSVAEDLNIDLENKTKNELIKSLRDFMSKQSGENKRVIIIVDEAQNLPDETLEELRLLSNLETDKDKLLQIILLGQPELESKLIADNLRQLNQRIVTRVHLQHFNEDETQDYINYRAVKAGKENLHIHKKAGALVYKLTNGVPRLINMLISRALMAAYLEESNLLTPKHISHAIKSLNHSDIKFKPRVDPIYAIASALVLVIIAAAYFFLSQGKSPADTKIEPPDTAVQSQQNIADTKEAVSTNTVTALPRESESLNVNEPAAPPSDSARPLPKIITVTVDVATIRSAPSLNSDKVGWTLKESNLEVLSEAIDSRNLKWYQVLFEGEKGWISAKITKTVD